LRRNVFCRKISHLCVQVLGGLIRVKVSSCSSEGQEAQVRLGLCCSPWLVDSVLLHPLLILPTVSLFLVTWRLGNHKCAHYLIEGFLMVQKHNDRPHGGLGGLHHDHKTKQTFILLYRLMWPMLLPQLWTCYSTSFTIQNQFL
jgi:hypothetical protein